MNLSKHFTLEELSHSEYAVRNGISNLPSAIITENLKKLAEKLEIVRTLLGDKPITISSGYRCPKVNLSIGGSNTSAHLMGLAADFICTQFGTPIEIAKVIANNVHLLDFDQCIYEGTWVHLGFSERPRRQVLTAQFSKYGAVYRVGIVE